MSCGLRPKGYDMQAQRCDGGCGRRAVTWWDRLDDEKPDDAWFFCAAHSDRSAEALVAKGYMQVADERYAPVVVSVPA